MSQHLPDHGALKWNFNNLAHSTDRFARRRFLLSELECEVVHQARIKYRATNAPIQLATMEENISLLENNLVLFAIDPQENNKISI